MLTLSSLLMSAGFGMILVAVAILGSEVYAEIVHRKTSADAVMPQVPKIRWRASIALVLLAWGPILLACSAVMTAAGAGHCT